MEDFLSSKLRVGIMIEVRFAVSKRGASDQVVWWPAEVCRVQASHGKSSSSLRGTLKYAAIHGYPVTKCGVEFRGREKVVDSSGVAYDWRFQEESNSEEDNVVSEPIGCDADPHDVDYVPQVKGERGTKRRVDDVEGNELMERTQWGFAELTRKVHTLQAEMDRVQAEMRGEAVLLRGLRTEFHSRTPSAATYAFVPLEFLRHRVEDMLQRGLTVPTRLTAGELRDGYSVFSQEVGRRSADCTLSQFDAIASRVMAKMGDVVTMDPPIDDVKTAEVDHISLTFPSLMELLEVFQPFSKGMVPRIIVKKKMERGGGRVSALRIIGTVYISDTNDQLPMVLKIGEGSVTPDVVMSVLYRKNTEWNFINDGYLNKLVIKTARGSVITEEMELVRGDGQSTEEHTRKNFTLNWKRESHMEHNRMLQRMPQPIEVLGTLDLSIPFVVVRGSAVCEEAVGLLERMKLEK